MTVAEKMLCPAEEIRVDGLTVIGGGRSSTVYMLDDDKILKAFRPSVPLSFIQQELKNAQTAYALGITTPKPYGMVKVGDHFGLVYASYAGHKTFEEMLAEPDCDRRQAVALFAKSVHRLHSVQVLPGSMPNAAEVFNGALNYLAPELGDEKTARIRQILDHIPDAGLFLHMDCHPGNCFYDEKAPAFFDFTFSKSGHPIYDLYGMYAHYIFWPAHRNDDSVAQEKYLALFRDFLSAYLGTDEENALQDAERQIRCVYEVIVALSPVVAPGLFTRQMMEDAYDILQADADWFCARDLIG